MILFLLITIASLLQTTDPTYTRLVGEGWKVGETVITFAEPSLRDGQDAGSERESLLKVVGTDRQLDEMLRDSVTAPFILKLRDVTAGDAIVRVADLYFAIHADLPNVKTEDVVRAKSGPPVEAGNMRFETRVLDPSEFLSQAIAPQDGTYYVHSSNRMLDRIQVESTDRVIATRGETSIVVSSQTDPRFDNDAKAPNRWRNLAKLGGLKEDGPSQVYKGAAGYVKVSKLKTQEGTLWVEVHFAFVEPRAWFDGAPILRSKLSLVAQDQIRRLRRELAKAKAAN